MAKRNLHLSRDELVVVVLALEDMAQTALYGEANGAPDAAHVRRVASSLIDRLRGGAAVRVRH